MSGKNGKSNIVDELNRSLAGLTSSRSPGSLLQSSGPSQRPIAVVERLATVSDQELIKYVQSTENLLKNRSIVSSLSDRGSKLVVNLEKAKAEVARRGLHGREASSVGHGNEMQQSDKSAVELAGSSTKSDTVPNVEDYSPTKAVTPGKKVLSAAAQTQPDLVNALKSLTLRDHHHDDPHTRGDIPHNATESPHHLPQKAVPLSIEESLKLEGQNQAFREALLKDLENDVRNNSQTSSEPFSSSSTDNRKMDFLRYREEETDELSDDDGDDDPDTIAEESENEDADMSGHQEALLP